MILRPRAEADSAAERSGNNTLVDAKQAVKFKVREYDYLMIEDEKENILNPDSLKVVEATVSPHSPM